MGFGLLSLGFLMTIFDFVCGGIIGFPIAVFALKKLGKFNNYFNYAAFSGVLCFAYSVINALAVLKIIDDGSKIYKICYTVNIAVLGLMTLFILLGIRAMAKDGGAERILSSANRSIYLTAVYFAWAFAVVFIPSISGGSLAVALLVARFAVSALNWFLIYTCFAKFTTDVQMQKDNEAIAKIEAKEEERKRKRKEEDSK